MAVILALLLVIATAAAAVYLFYRNKFRFWKQRGFPSSTTPVRIWGDIKGVNSKISMGESISQLYNEHPNENFVGVYLLHTPALVVRDPELIKSIFVRDFMNFHDRGIYVNEKNDPLSAHLFSIGGTKWRNLRVKLTPTFTTGKMKNMFHILAECSKEFAKVLEIPAQNNQVIEVKDYAARFTTDIISSAAFGLETNSLTNPQSEFRHYGQKLFEPTPKMLLANLLAVFSPGLSKLFGMKVIPQDIEDFFIGVLKETIQFRKEKNIKRNDFLDLMIQLMEKGRIEDVDEPTNVKDENDTKFSFLEAAAQCFVFFIAGFETSSTTMQYALYELAKNPDIQEKAREEVKRVLKKHGGEMTYEAIMEMSFLGQVLDETLRLYTPVPFLQRECNKDYSIPGTDLVLPKGTTAIIPIMAIQRDEKYYPNPNTFDPDRFTEEEKAKRHHYTYLPFGEGPRNCIGLRFGLLQSRVGLATLLNKYRFSVAKETPIPMVFEPKSFVLTPSGGMNLRISKCE